MHSGPPLPWRTLVQTQYTDYTLRERTAYLDCDETTAGRACEQTDSDVIPASLLSVLEIEETLLRTHGALSGSRTLLAAEI
jgi:hypothetical protein